MIKTKTIISIFATALLVTAFTACADKKPVNSSYDKDNSSWQQFKAKKALDNMD